MQRHFIRKSNFFLFFWLIFFYLLFRVEPQSLEGALAHLHNFHVVLSFQILDKWREHNNSDPIHLYYVKKFHVILENMVIGNCLASCVVFEQFLEGLRLEFGIEQHCYVKLDHHPLFVCHLYKINHYVNRCICAVLHGKLSKALECQPKNGQAAPHNFWQIIWQI